MFPTTDRSDTIIGCLTRAAAAAGIDIRLQASVAAVRHDETDGSFHVQLRGADPASATLRARRVLIATGGGRASAGFTIAESFGHTIEPLVPSLFTFHIDDPRLKGLEGLSVPRAAARSDQAKLATEGPALVTHWGLSGPAILRLSAWSAREFAACAYRFALQLSWIGPVPLPAAKAALVEARTGPHARQKLANWNPWALPSRLWERIAATAGAADSAIWASASNALLDRLAEEAAAAKFSVTGKSLNKEEFVTCGGVRLAEVDFRTMESKRRPGLHFAGEVLDIDGVTGGFNFQAAWTTSRLAGLAMRPPPA